MFRHRITAFLLVASLLVLISGIPAFSQDHPRMYFDQGDISDIRAKANNQLSALRNQILAAANGNLGSPPAETRNMYSLRSYGTDLIALAFAWVMTGESKYFDATKARLLEYATWEYWDREPDVRGLALSDMLIGNALAYDWLYRDLTASERTTIRDSLAKQARRMYEAGISRSYNGSWANWWSNSYVQNHSLIDWSGLGVAGLVLDGEVSDAGSFINAAKYAWTNIRSVLNAKYDASWHESTNYGAYAFTKSLIFLVNLRKVKGVDLIPHSFFRKYSLWRTYNYLPDTLMMAVPTGDFGWDWNDPSSPHILRFCASEYRDGRAQWLADYIANNVIPRTSNSFAGSETVLEFLVFNTALNSISPGSLPTYARFDDMEGVVWRSGWSSGDFVFSFKTGAYGGRASYDNWLNYTSPWNTNLSQGLSTRLNVGHDHDDQHSFFIFYNGSWAAPEHTEYGKAGASYHNSILIDGTGQLRPQDANWNDYPKNGAPSDGKLKKTIDYADYHYLVADGGNLYDTLPDVQRLYRYILYIKPRTVLVVDDMRTGNNRTFEWVSHFGAGTSRDGDWIKSSPGSNLFGVQHLTTNGQSVSLGNDGTPYMRTSNNTKNKKTVMAHLLHAMPGGTWGSRPNGEVLEDDGSVIVIRIANADGTSLDVFIDYGGDAGMRTVGGLKTNADLAIVERNAGGSAVRVYIHGGTAIYDNGGNLLLAEGLDSGVAYDISRLNQENLQINFGAVR